ncbi:hypothetical protein DSCA_26640 [Desulfosarcina alkanivorans]|uniref:Uncharacterized protein n=1 Tax=Desulfosarcina alkanivorans TaxID=571177 RepID=A0A5K7YR10_9BACT|nr:hypothetical protein [Desulfosarcina alkanivorans]BBO68734.1 hypothetical protein DSCA_26640 [Desulfosarcina alkanivorans]
MPTIGSGQLPGPMVFLSYLKDLVLWARSMAAGYACMDYKRIQESESRILNPEEGFAIGSFLRKKPQARSDILTPGF